MSSKESEKQRTIRLLKGLKCDTCKYKFFDNGRQRCIALITEPFPLKEDKCVAYHPSA